MPADETLELARVTAGALRVCAIAAASLELVRPRATLASAQLFLANGRSRSSADGHVEVELGQWALGAGAQLVGTWSWSSPAEQVGAGAAQLALEPSWSC